MTKSSDTQKPNGWSRRRVLTTAASGLALAAASSFPMPAIAQGKKLTYWGGLIFSDDANKLLTDTINAWGAANGVATEVVMINQNETTQKVSAAVSSNTMPDALDMGLGLARLLARQSQFSDLGDLYKKIGDAQGGWFSGPDTATDLTADGGIARVGIPFGVNGNLLLRRKDLLEPAGFTEAPKTWDELVTQAEAINKAPVSGLGLALSNVGDANLQVAVLQSFGGRIADDAGKKVTLDTPETRLWLTWLKNAWDKGLFSPGNTTWDGAGDNQAYLSGQAGFIANTGSVGIAAKKDDPELFEASAFSPLPGGPKGIISPIDVQVRAITKASSVQDEAKALLEHLSSPEFMNAYFNVAIYGPVLADQEKLPAFDGTNTILVGLLGLAKNGTAPAYPDVNNAAFADFGSNFLIPKLAQRVVVDGWDFDQAIAEAQAQGQAIYDKY
ncbi:MAG TPA: extracellular solute-binding protein [Devosia sp.]|jgi:multiple sugar transport system substrate-binding protein|uniref:ABC transporter substrate-binding protein n=1 Tax=Devosia sp. TaxID=1871048 RepID=UPI002DDCDEBA|nr:extracellular solute-binding protein [Devosia sp.]HEV2516005.1 extracellular solute-binding protein [Devosia sp.]